MLAELRTAEFAGATEGFRKVLGNAPTIRMNQACDLERKLQEFRGYYAPHLDNHPAAVLVHSENWLVSMG